MRSQCLSCHRHTEIPLKKGYHPECSRRLFGVETPPDILFSTSEISHEARKMVGKISVSGVQVQYANVFERLNTLRENLEKMIEASRLSEELQSGFLEIVQDRLVRLLG